jgi:SnoaL-like protein
MDMTELERRLTRMEDIEAIKHLKARYCDICDDDHNPAKITTLFVDDGIWEAGGFGKAQGHEGIRQLFQGFQKMISFSQHMVVNPLIEVNGNTAKGTWYFLGPFTFRKNNEAKWQAVKYEDDYVKVNGEWKYKHLRAHIRMAAAPNESWANKEG